MSFESKVDNLWQNPYGLDLSWHIVFFIRITDFGATSGSMWGADSPRLE